MPAPLPPRLRYSGRLVVALSRADAALGVLSGIAEELPDPEPLVAPFLRQEALCSSHIEGSRVTFAEVLLDEVAAAPPSADRDQLREVRNCIAALQYGVERVRRAPLSLGLICELHEQLLRGELGTTRTPGELRQSQNWVGPPGSTLATATYVPPPPAEVRPALAAWESFSAERGGLPDLVQCAMMHEQFEAIHPFVGGNGRLGRILISLFLAERRLAQPLLYLSAWFEARREEYYVLLQRVRTHGEWVPWLMFFLTGVRETAESAAAQARLLLRLRAESRARVKGQALAVIDELFRMPFITVPEVQRALAGPNATARRVVHALQAADLLEGLAGRGRPRVYGAPAVIEALQRPFNDLRAVDKSPAGAPGELQKSGLGTERVLSSPGDRLMAEAMAIIDAARRSGVELRLTGGLAVRRHCTDLEFMEREYSDIDVVGLSDQTHELHEVFAALGYTENRYVSQATGAGQLQYIKKEYLEAQARLGEDPGASIQRDPALLVDHVDIFLDVMRMDHDVDVRGRLDIDDYAISPVDTLIAKLQIGKINQKDVHDVIALVKDMPLRETDDDMSIDVPYLADVCARDWGLYHDVTTNLDITLDRIDDYGLSEEEVARVYGRLAAIREAIVDETKSLRWRLRATVGKRVAWRREVEDTEGTMVIAPEWDWRRDLG